MHIMAIATALANTTPEKNNVFASSNETLYNYSVEDGLFGGSNHSYAPMGNTTSAATGDGMMEFRRQNINQSGRERHNKKEKKNMRSNRHSNSNNDENKNQPKRQQGNSSSRSSCFSIETYKSLDNDISRIRNDIRDDKKRSHFLGGIVRLAAHDFMDYNQHASYKNRMGPDGCFDKSHPSNDGLDTIWCPDCPLKMLYVKKYSHLSRADYWIASANAVIRQTSIDNGLDLRDEFRWGRQDADSCEGSGDRLPQASGCGEVEGVFLNRMGLRWSDAVALLGAHTLGRARNEFSGHEGTWSSSDRAAQVFDKKYYEALLSEPWRPRNMGSDDQDWTTGRGDTRLMLNTDMCLVFDIEENLDRNIPCCSKASGCEDNEASRKRCPMYAQHDRMQRASDVVHDMLGGSISSKNNDPFYTAFSRAWEKATTVGQKNLSPLEENCESI